METVEVEDIKVGDTVMSTDGQISGDTMGVVTETGWDGYALAVFKVLTPSDGVHRWCDVSEGNRHQWTVLR